MKVYIITVLGEDSGTTMVFGVYATLEDANKAVIKNAELVNMPWYIDDDDGCAKARLWWVTEHDVRQKGCGDE